MQSTKSELQALTKKSEILLFVFLTFVFIPGTTVGLVGAYGFSVWVYQAFIGGFPTG